MMTTEKLLALSSGKIDNSEYQALKVLKPAEQKLRSIEGIFLKDSEKSEIKMK